MTPVEGPSPVAPQDVAPIVGPPIPDSIAHPAQASADSSSAADIPNSAAEPQAEAPAAEPPTEASPTPATPENFNKAESVDTVMNVANNLMNAKAGEINKTVDDMDSAQGAKFLGENRGKQALRELSYYRDTKTLPVDKNVADSGNPIKIVGIGQDGKMEENVITKIKSATADTFVCETALKQTLTISREQFAQAFMTAEKEAIANEFEGAEKAIVEKSLQAIESGVLVQENPLENLPDDELKQLSTSAENLQQGLDAKTKAAEAQEEEPDEVKRMKFRVAEQAAKDGVIYIPLHEEATLMHYEKAYPQFKQILKENLEAKEKEMGRKLTDEERLLVQMQTIGKIQTANEKGHVWNAQNESAFQMWMSNFIAERGVAPTEEQQEGYKTLLRRWAGNQRDLNVIMNEHTLAEMTKKISKEDKLAIIVLLTTMIGEELFKDLLPTLQ